jgi:hypothetical protein
MKIVKNIVFCLVLMISACEETPVNQAVVSDTTNDVSEVSDASDDVTLDSADVQDEIILEDIEIISTE